MKIIQENNLYILVPRDEFLLKAKDDIYQEAYVDENGNEIREHIPYTFKKAYIPKDMFLQEAKEIYEEIGEKEK